MSMGKKFRQAVDDNNPLQVVGAVNAYMAIMAEKVGHKAIYLSGGGVAACSMGIPDLGITTMKDVLEDTYRITDASELPLLVDIDTGWGGAFNIARCVREFTRAGAGAVHLEDQVMQKRCGHRPNKAIISQGEMVDRVKSAVDAKTDSDFVIMARTDALAVEGMQSAIDRAIACVEAGADMIFPEAINTLEQYEEFVKAVDVPVLANITEFGATPLFTSEELASVGVKLQLYPLSAFRAMSKAALNVYEHIKEDGHQKDVIDSMQTRMELYDFLGYHEYEQKLDQLFASEEK
ncbi:methylisocitrate lyase [Cocleimonas sp. KMM 6892]|uniref:methylisocitrate lyase n=1 Tax=unclassified Cocleimonas TaxID=2639732 RepID=UPI002DBBCD92|nr:MULTISPECIES: methylisocitrate lyase [unclassified Cocleimonas]MEB8434264.1 methylisocitrate lyase [Cocleimonas sp. KMM 6892]MEC4717117.1 methylisocitrate lyase [Cocleimonas sp. KMM 6895]MEC4746536.1 methylisocitrate lyase [Cocleimonas sp. KMM 6896]